MKLLVKRIYCSNCHKLVRGREQKVNSNIRVSCPKCGHNLRTWDGLTWRPLHEPA